MTDYFLVSCACGKKLRVGREHLGQRVKCSDCGTIVRAPEHPPEAGAIPEGGALTAGPKEIGTKCSICQTSIEAFSTVVYCDLCKIPFHHECWEENGGCATYACTRAPKTAKLPSVQPAPHGWGDTKLCPACGKEIRSIALKCLHCGARFETTDPMSKEEYRRQRQLGEKARTAPKTAMILFVLSMLGCLAFIMLPISLWWIRANRKVLSRIPGEHMALAYAAAVVSALYSLFFIAFVLLD